jgi:sigma-E factor negative regulatory protein RseB
MEFRSRPAGGMSPGTDAASLRVITTAVLVGLVASGVALASGLGLLTGGGGAQRPVGGPGQAAALKLLRAAAQACRSLPYQGVEVAWWGPGSQAGGDTSVVQVWHQPGGQALAQDSGAQAPAQDSGARALTQDSGAQALTRAPVALLAGRGQHHQPASSLGSGGPNLDEAGVLGMNTQLVSLLAANYVVTVAGRGQVAGRPARIVTVRRPGGGVAAWLWLDSATSLPLRKEMFDARTRLISSVTFAEVNIGRGAVSGQPVPTARAWRTTLAPGQLARLRASGWPLPGPLPADLTLIGAKESTTPAGPVVDLDYSDGLSVVSIFVQRGYLPARLRGWSQVALAGHKVYANDPDELCFAWSARGFVYTLIAAAPQQTVGQVVVALPHDDDSGWLAQLRHGLHRLLSWVGP